MNIALIIPYFGQWPIWMDLYLMSVGLNPNLHILFYTDIPTDNFINIPPNVHFSKISYIEYCKKISLKLKIDFKPENPYKLCDIKPFLPYIHEDEITDYDFVGWGDIDLVYGCINNFFNDKVLSKYDIISTHCHIFSGHFTILRNNKEIYNNFFLIEDWKNLVLNQKNLSVDEIVLTRTLIKDIKLLKFIYYFFGGHLGKRSHIATFIYHKGLKLFHPRFHLKEMWTTPKYNQNKKYFWQNGIVYNEKKQKLPYLHFLFFKKTDYYKENIFYWKKGFYKLTPEDINPNNTFQIDIDGISKI